jgi:hypothetical protein
LLQLQHVEEWNAKGQSYETLALPHDSPWPAPCSSAIEEKPHQTLSPDRDGRYGAAGARLPNRRRSHRSDGSGLAVFELIRHQLGGSQAVLCAFDLLNSTARTCVGCRSSSASGRWPSCCARAIPVSRSTSTTLATARSFSRSPATLAARARVEAAWLAYRSGRSKQWLKVKNPAGTGGTARD